MRYRLVLVMILFAFGAPEESTARVEDFVPGESWLAKSENDRFLWAWGVVDGQALIFEAYGDLSSQIKENRIATDGLYSITKIMTQYYQDAANSKIPWKYMIVVASIRLRGASEAMINERLESLRKYSLWMRKK